MPSINFSFKKATNLNSAYRGNLTIGNEITVYAPSATTANYCFYSASNVKVVNLEAPLCTDLGGCFYGSTKLDTVNLEAKCTAKMANCFQLTTSLKNINFKNFMVPSTVASMFYQSGIEDFPQNIDFRKSTDSLPNDIFSGCSKLKGVETNYIKFAQALFSGCSSLKYGIFLSGCTTNSVQAYDFIGCGKLTYFYGLCNAYYTGRMFSGCGSLIKVYLTAFGNNAIECTFVNSILNLDSVKHMCSVYQPHATAKPSPQISFGIGLLQTADPETTDYTVKYITADGTLSDNKADGIRNTYIKTLDEITEEGITDYGYSATNSGTTYYAVGELYTALKSLEDRSVSFTVAYN